jgi:hypothetical protein
MASLQYVLDSICSKLTSESMYEMVKLQLNHGPFKMAEIIPAIRNKDRSLDYESAKMIAEAAFRDMFGSGEIRIEGDFVYPAS